MQQLLRLPVNQRAVSALLTPFYFLFQSKKLQLRLAMLVMSVGMMSGVVGQATVKTDKDDYMPGEYVIITGAGWQPGERVDFHFEEDPKPATCVNSHDNFAIADAAGNIFYNQFLIRDNHLGVSFILTATGISSGRTAQTTFTDAAYQFGASGLPSQTSVIVNWTISGSGGGNGTFTSSPFTPPALSTQPNINNKTITVNSYSTTYDPNPPAGNINYVILNYGLRIGASNQPTNIQTSNSFSIGAAGASNAALFTANYGALVVSPVTSAYGSTVNLSATLYSNYQTLATIASKTIEFKIGTTVVGTQTANVSGVASLSYNLGSLAPGEYTITASFAGETNIYLPIDGTAKLIVGKGPSTINVTGSNSFIYSGLAQGPSNSNVTGSTGTRTYTYTGTGSTTYGPSTTAPTNAGTYSVTAILAEDANYNSATSAAFAFTIDKAPTTTVVTIVGGPFTYTGAAQTPATVSVTGAGGLNLTPTADYGNNIDAGTATASYTYAESANYLSSSDSKNFTITKANATINVTGYSGVYDGASHGATGSATGVLSEVLSGLNLGASYTNVPGGTANWTFTDVTGNYNNASGSVQILISTKAASVTPNTANKYCGQADPTFTGTLSGFLAGDGVAATYTRTIGESVGGLYTISAVLSPAGVLSNYNITYNTATFTINNLAIDASGSSTPVAIGQNATLSAVVSPAVAGVTVKFYVDGVEKGFGVTDGSGIATYTLTGLNTTDVYKIEAVAGTGGCASTAAYLPVYDPNGAFVTGGGWINSPSGSLTANSSIVGKANFGFVSKYKKGSSIVDGNTEFQFHAGDINFKSTMHESGSLVIAGAKATYRGTGTINGLAGYKFTIVAIDGNWNNGVGPDKFRIKITTTAGAVIYDNQMGKDDNADDATVLGGGSIVIHEVKRKTSNRMDPGVLVLTPQEFGVKVLGNPSLSTFRLQLQSNDMQQKFTVKVVDINGRLIEVQQNLYAGQVIELGSKYTQGTYFAEVMQGNNRKVVNLIKIGRD